MLAAWQDTIRREIEQGTGALIGLVEEKPKSRTELRIWFADLDQKHGPVIEFKPVGMRRYSIILQFGRFSGEVLKQIAKADPEDVRLARSLVGSIKDDVTLDFGAQTREDWRILSGDFQLKASGRMAEGIPDGEAVARVSREVIVPMMAAMAELIGYDVIDEEGSEDHAMEGAILISTIRRRERNPRNRLLCIRLHGEKCACCGFEPRTVYREAGDIIEVHHLEALSLLEAPRAYDPAIDLAPLCPNCHRAVHTRRPIPLSLNEARAILSGTRHLGWIS